MIRVPLWKNGDSQELNVQTTDAASLQILQFDISRTPTTDELDKMLGVLVFYVGNTEADFVFHARHVRSDALDNIKLDMCLKCARCIVENKENASKVQKILMECTVVDPAAEMATNLFSMTTGVPLLLTASKEEAEKAVAKQIAKQIAKHVKRATRVISRE